MNVDSLKYDGPSPAAAALDFGSIDKEQELDADKRSADFDSPPGSASGHDDDSVELTAAERRTERRFLWKLDLLLMTWAWLGALCCACLPPIEPLADDLSLLSAPEAYCMKFVRFLVCSTGLWLTLPFFRL